MKNYFLGGVLMLINLINTLFIAFYFRSALIMFDIHSTVLEKIKEVQTDKEEGKIPLDLEALNNSLFDVYFYSFITIILVITLILLIKNTYDFYKKENKETIFFKGTVIFLIGIIISTVPILIKQALFFIK